MRLVLQRVSRAAVTIDGGETRAIGPGLVALLGVCAEDDGGEPKPLADKMARLRIFDDEAGNLNLSLLDVAGECLIISNFTLYAQCKKGRRPSFVQAAPPERAKALYQQFVAEVEALGVQRVATGEFGAEMKIDMTCDGPVTILLDSVELLPKGQG